MPKSKHVNGKHCNWTVKCRILYILKAIGDIRKTSSVLILLCTLYSHEGRAFIYQHEKCSIPPAGLPPRRRGAGSPAVHRGGVLTGRQFPTNHWLQWSPHVSLRLQRRPISIWRPWGQGKVKWNHSHIHQHLILKISPVKLKWKFIALVAPNGVTKMIVSKQDSKNFSASSLFRLQPHTIGCSRVKEHEKKGEEH